VNSSYSTGRRASRKAVVGIFVGVAAALAVASLAFACTPRNGFTWYSDGTFSKSGPTGSRISAYATGAVPGQEFRLVIANTVTPGHGGHACMDNATEINPNSRFASPSGFIGLTSGTVNKGPGEWQICFWAPDLGSATTPVTFVVV
jgi:hypothetical protein